MRALNDMNPFSRRHRVRQRQQRQRNTACDGHERNQPHLKDFIKMALIYLPPSTLCHSPPVAGSRHCFRRHRCQPRLLHVVRQVVYVVNAVDDNVIAHVIHFVLTFQGHCDVFATAGTRSRLTNSGLYDEPACGNTCAPPFFYSSFLLLFFSS